MSDQDSEQTVRFAAFELDLKAGELRRAGARLPVQGRPLQVLAVLLRTPGQLVTTEQLRTELWPATAFVDFEHGIRNAVARLRAVLGDTATQPRYIETLPRRGYRFVGAVAERPTVSAGLPEPAELLSPPVTAPAWNRKRIVLVSFAACVCLAGALLYTPSGRRPPTLSGPIHSLAVLPLENLSGNKSEDYFADGVTDELITALAKLHSVQVISRTTVMQYKGMHSKPLPQIARELGVDAVVEGTLVRSGSRVRVTAQLIESATDRHLWADRYERDERDILLLEQDIATAVMGHVQDLHTSEEARAFRARPIDPAAHEAYLQGQQLANRRTQAAINEAIRWYNVAIEKEPEYAAGYIGRASAYIALSGWAVEAIPPTEGMEKARADAEKAIELDEGSGEAYTVRAVVREVYEWDARGAETEYRRAIELSPSNATAHLWYGQYLCNRERFPECLAETARAHALDPALLVAAADLGYRLYEARRFAEAIAPIQKVLEFNPDFVLGHGKLGQVYEANRMYPEAIAEITKALQLSGGVPRELAALGHAYAVSGRTADARRVLTQLEALSRQRYVPSYGRALVYAGLGEKDHALEWLSRSRDERSPWIAKLKVDPRFDPLRTEPRFIELLRRYEGSALPPSSGTPSALSGAGRTASTADTSRRP